ncbi:MAG: polyphosphate kinase 1 [Bacteroidia bacterium]
MKIPKDILTEREIFIPRDLSWLSFNGRVLQEAADPTVPLIERIKFLGIFSSNGDEFFRVRVATLKRMIKLGKKSTKMYGFDVDEILDRIQKTVLKQQALFEEIYQNILGELEINSIFIINEQQLNGEQGRYVREYFRNHILPTLVPIMLDGLKAFPVMKDKTIYLLITLIKKGDSRKIKHALIEVPTNVLSRFLVLPKENKYIILLDDVIRYCLDDIFYYFEYDEAKAYTIKITRDGELDIENDVTKSLVKKVAESVKRRKKGQPTRLIYDEAIPTESLNFTLKKLKLKKEDNLQPGGRYHNFIDFINFPSIGPATLRYHVNKPIVPTIYQVNKSLLGVIKKQDVILHFPYQSYDMIIHILREASIDPRVKSISITLYRVARNSNIVNTLINAIRNGKKVTCLVELQARFDEENNITSANRLIEEGVKIIYGVPGLKAHGKLFLISRLESGKLVDYAHIGTGNFNEATAKIYCDHSLLTSDKRITEEVKRIFDFYNDNYKTGTYKHLLVAPFFMRKKFVALIQKEIDNAKEKKPAYIILKLNSLTDEDMIRKLYEASEAGVNIKIIVRGICSLIPQVKNLSMNIEVISIVDKYLEHARVFVFANGGDEKYFISSADWMQRNLDFRSEVATPVYDKNLQNELRNILDIQWNDNVKARLINAVQDNHYVSELKPEKIKIRAQDEIYNYLKKL